VIITIIVVLFVVNLYPSGNGLSYHFAPLYTVHDQEFEKTMGSLLGPPFTMENQTESLKNGVQIFPAMLDAIKNAQKSITFKTFIYWSGDVGTKFSKALSERAKAGVHVLVILDAVGSDDLNKDLLDEMRINGVKVFRYRPVLASIH